MKLGIWLTVAGCVLLAGCSSFPPSRYGKQLQSMELTHPPDPALMNNRQAIEPYLNSGLFDMGKRATN